MHTIEAHFTAGYIALGKIRAGHSKNACQLSIPCNHLGRKVTEGILMLNQRKIVIYFSLLELILCVRERPGISHQTTVPRVL